MRTKEEIGMLLAEKFKRESARLKSWGTKTDEKAAMSFAMAVSEFVRALMCESRYRELKRFQKKLEYHVKYKGSKGIERKVLSHLHERLKATSSMAKAIQHVAEKSEERRPWQFKSSRKEKHKHRSKHGNRSN